MKIAFVFADYETKKFEEDVDIVSRKFGTFPPLGLGYAAAIAERAGHETLIIDAHAEKLTSNQVLERIKPFKPDLLGFMLTTYMFHDTMALITYLKRETGLPVVVGNVQLELYPRETMEYPEIDYGIIGSAVDVFPALLEAHESGKPIPDYPGLCYKKNGQVVISKPRSLAEDFSRLPFPKRKGLPNHIYHSVMSKRKNVTAMVTAKGCPSNCTFCHIHKTPYTTRSPEATVNEIEQCVSEHSIHEFEIFDPSFTIDRERVLEICEEIVRRDLDIDFACRARVDQVDPELLAKMAQAGCKRILYGIESGSQKQLDAVQKGITLDRVRNAVKWTKEVGILALGFFLIGTPNETEQTVEETIRFAIELDLDYAQFHRTMAKPRTQLHKLVTEHLGYDYWQRYVTGDQPEIRLPAPWTKLSNEEIERETYRAYRRFYMRPTYLAKTVLGIRSWSEFFRYVQSGIGLLLGKSHLK